MTTQPHPAPLPYIIRAAAGHAIDTADSSLLFKLTAQDAASGFSLALSVTQPGGGPPPHLHHHATEVFIMLEGELQIGSVQGWQTARPGDVVFLPAGSVHSFRNTGTRPSRHWVLLTTADFETFYTEFARILNDAPGGSPDRQQLQATAAQHGIQFVAPDVLPPIDAPR